MATEEERGTQPRADRSANRVRRAAVVAHAEHVPMRREYSLVAIAAGVALILFALTIVLTRADLPYKRLLMYAGVAAMFSGIGANAAVRMDLKGAGQAGAAGGAAAIAIILGWTIGPDQKSDVPRLNMTYYVNFPDGKKRSPEDLKAAVSVVEENQTQPRDLGAVPVSWAPGGNAVKLTVTDVSAHDVITLRIHSGRENRDWTSAAIQLTESFMNLNEGD